MTPTQPSQSVESERETFDAWFYRKYAADPERAAVFTAASTLDLMRSAWQAARAELACPQEVAAVGDDVFWLYELTKGEGIYQGCKGKNAEHIMRQTVSGIEDAGEPFCVPTSRVPVALPAKTEHEREFWALLHEWKDTQDTERADWIENRINELMHITATPAPKGDAKDAERYRWLTYAGWIDDAIMAEHGIKEGISETLNAAIDAAILASKATAAGEGK